MQLAAVKSIWLEAASRPVNLALAASVALLNLCNHPLLRLTVCVRVDDCVDGLGVLVILKVRRRGCHVRGLEVLVLRLGTVGREEMSGCVLQVRVVRRLPRHLLQLALELRIYENLRLRINVVLVVGRTKLLVVGL